MSLKADIWTYADAIAHALDYLGAASDAQTERIARRAVQSAYQTLHSQRNWVCYYQLGHVNTVPPYDTGTITYTDATRQLTLTGGTWPSWAADGMVAIGNVAYPVVTRNSDSVLTLASANNPGQDLASTTYQIYRESYDLPVDFGAMDALYRMDGMPFSLTYLAPGDFLGNQALNVGPSEPRFYTITNDPNRYSTIMLRFRPAPSDYFPFSFVYRRRPRALRVDGYSDGTVNATSASTTVTGIGTVWASNLVGSIIRFAQNSTQPIPTGLSGANPFWLERSITGVANATSLTIDVQPGEDLTGVKYSIADPVDIEAGSMIVYFLREIERQCRIVKRMKPASPDENTQYEIALKQAFEADSRRFEALSAGAGFKWNPALLKYGQVLPDVS